MNDTAHKMKIGHTGDLHYCMKFLSEVDRCFGFVVEKAIAEGCECAVIAGDLFDSRIDLHSPAVAALLNRVVTLANAMPVLILQGTAGHDAPGCLEVFKTLGARHPVLVADRICQCALIRQAENAYAWMISDSTELDIEALVDTFPKGTIRAVFSCLPPVNKAAIAVARLLEWAGREVGEWIVEIFKDWSVIHLKSRQHNINTVLVSHGTVHGSMTEHGVPMLGFDNEFTTESLFAAEASAVLLSHIHRHQSWQKDGRRIAYPSSPGKLHFGEIDDKGFLIWQIQPDSATFEFHRTPAKTLLQFDFDGPPDLAALAKAAAEIDPGKPTHVRVRYQIDEEFRASVDRAGIEKLFHDAGALEIKIEGRILPIQRSRSAGMNQLTSLADRLNLWCEVTKTEAVPLLDRLHVLESTDPETIVHNFRLQNLESSDANKKHY